MPKEKRAMERERFGTVSQAMYDAVCNDNVTSREAVLQIGALAALAADYPAALKEGERIRKKKDGSLATNAMSGARSFARNGLRIAVRDKNIVTLSDGETLQPQAQFAREWLLQLDVEKEQRPREPVTVQKFGTVTSYAGMTEWEGWAYAPLKARDSAKVRLLHPIPLDQLRATFPGWSVTESADGLVDVSAHVDAPVKAVVSEWLKANNIVHEGVRDARNVRRRNLSELPYQFRNEVILKSLPIAHGVVSRRHGAAMEVLTGSMEDAQAWVRLWVVELVSTFNAELGRPFGTWVNSQMKYKIQNLNREINGRTASDLEIRFAKAQERLTNETGRIPDPKELADEMGISRNQLNSKSTVLQQLRAIRSANTLDTAPDVPEVPIVDVRENPEREAVDRETASRVTMALLAASGTVNSATGQSVLEYPLGFLITYAMEWGEWVKTDLTHLAGCPSSQVGNQLRAVQAHLKRDLHDLQDREVKH